MRGFIQDLRYAFRMALKTPGVTLVAVLSIALGIGANTVIFAWVKALLLEPVPGAAAPDQLVDICGSDRVANDRTISYPDYKDYRDRNKAFAGMTVFRMMPLSLGGKEKAERIWGNIVSGNHFEVYGVTPMLGRAFLPEEDLTPNSHPVVVIGYGLWQTKLGADPNVVGRTIKINGFDFMVVGVSPPTFQGAYTALSCDVWVPIMMQEKVYPAPYAITGRGARWLNMTARLKPGVSLEQAQADLTVISNQLAKEYPQQNEFYTARLYQLGTSPLGPEKIMRPVLIALTVIVGIVLLIACVNIANLLIARAAGRSKEIGIRLAVGAGRFRLVRQMMTESLVLAVAGGLGGLIIAYQLSDSLTTFLPPIGFPIKVNTGVDARVLGFTLLVTAATGFLFGLIPALQAAKADLVSVLKEESGLQAGTGRKLTLRNLLVFVQVALSAVALVCGGLLLRSLNNSLTADPGFKTDKIVLGTFDVFLSNYDEKQGLQFYKRLQEQVSELPGVKSAAFARRLPLNIRNTSSTSFSIEGYTPPNDGTLSISYDVVTPNSFKTLGIPVIDGRDFTVRDDETAKKVAVVNETTAKRFWPGESAVGKRLSISTNEWREIVGVVKDIKYKSINESPQMFLYLPHAQSYRATMTLLVETDADVKTMLGHIQGAVASLDPNMPIFDVTTIRTHIGTSLFAQRMAAVLLGIFGLFALLLAGIGMYGVTAYTVSRRTREIGIRMALGARASDILKAVLGAGLATTSAGIVAGVLLAAALSKPLKSLLYGVKGYDPVTLSGVVAVLIVAAVLAGLIPARRAMKVNPVVALRNE